MIDATATTGEWRKHAGDVVILPVGSVEQHDGHRPPSTDCIGAEGRDRIERLRRQPRYAGAAGIVIRRLGPNDLPAAMRLKTLARWNQTEADWTQCLQMSPEGCLGLVQNGTLQGTAVVVRYAPDTCWIGMVLVDPDVRRMGLGTRLMEAALDVAGQNGSVLLDAAPAGRPLYVRLGFRDLGTVLRLTGTARVTVQADETTVSALEADGLEAMIAADQSIAGCDRSALLTGLYARHPELALGIRREGRWVAFCLGREGTDCRQIGPVIASSEADAVAVVAASIRARTVGPVLLDVPASHHGVIDFLEQAGLTLQRGFTRMVLGAETSPRITDGWYACAGPEFG